MKREEKLNIENLLTELKENLKEHFGEELQKCVLFGSYSNLTESDESDIDVLVLLNLPKDQIEKHHYKLDKITLELSLKYDVVVSLLTKNSKEFYQYSDVIPLYRNIVKEGKEIYG